MRPLVFPIVFWLSVLIALGGSMQYWISVKEEKCLRYCADQGMKGVYNPPRSKGRMRFARNMTPPDSNCKCLEPDR
ncbi:MAG: hypothetical protein KDI33_11805 [Halioglobus sp.]|nr:hypothetical protein [Halioglobus sp.]